jgi:hypothetical protein
VTTGTSATIVDASDAIRVISEGAAQVYALAILYGQALQTTENNSGVSPTGVDLAQMKSNPEFVAATQTEATAQELSTTRITVVNDSLTDGPSVFASAPASEPQRRVGTLSLEAARTRVNRVIGAVRDVGITEGRALVPRP